MLEINTTPGMTVTSFIPQQVRAAYNIRIKTNKKKVDLNKVRVYTKVVIKFDKIFGGLYL